MKSIVVYGSTTGNTENAAEKIAEALGAEKTIEVANCSPADLADYDLIVFGSSTWGSGDLQDDWETALPQISEVDYTGKKAALFVLGDQEGYPDTFAGALAIIYDALKSKNVEIIGETSTEGYTFDESEAVRDGKFVGLVLDEDNQDDLTDSRIEAWVNQIKG